MKRNALLVYKKPGKESGTEQNYVEHKFSHGVEAKNVWIPMFESCTEEKCLLTLREFEAMVTLYKIVLAMPLP